MKEIHDLGMEFVVSSASVSQVYVRGVDGTQFDDLSGESKFAILSGIIAQHDLNNFAIQQVVKNLSK